MNLLENLVKNVTLLQDDLQSLEGHNCPETLAKVLFEADRLNSFIVSFRSTVLDFQNQMAETQKYNNDDIIEEEKLQVPSQIEAEIEVKTDDLAVKSDDIKIEDSFWGDEDDEDFFTHEVTSNGM